MGYLYYASQKVVWPKWLIGYVKWMKFLMITGMCHDTTGNNCP